jgi:hypothetical protein
MPGMQAFRAFLLLLGIPERRAVAFSLRKTPIDAETLHYTYRRNALAQQWMWHKGRGHRPDGISASYSRKAVVNVCLFALNSIFSSSCLLR